MIHFFLFIPVSYTHLDVYKRQEQIDAIRVLRVNPVYYLFTPRVIAGTLMMPVVVIVSSLFGILGGAVASNLASGLTYKAYFDSVWFGLNMHDLNVCILKSLAFGFVITLISCSCGMEARAVSYTHLVFRCCRFGI